MIERRGLGGGVLLLEIPSLVTIGDCWWWVKGIRRALMARWEKGANV